MKIVSLKITEIFKSLMKNNILQLHTVAIFLLSVFSLKKNSILKALFVLSIITVVISLLPLMYGLNYYTLVGAFITVTLVIESILAKIQQK